MALKDAILETLSCMLSANNELRKIAEERKKALEVAEEYPIYLLEIILTTDEAAEERQMACVLFKHFIKYHWLPDRNSYVSINDTTRMKIKSILPMGLCDPLPKIRNAIAHSLALLAHYEYPHNWLELIDLISLRLKSNDYNEVVGIVMFLDECTRILSIQVICMMAPVLYNDLFSLCQNEMYPVHVRILVIEIVTKLISSSMYSHNYESFGSTVTNFIMLFGIQLTKTYNSNNDFKLKSEIFKTFQELIITMDEIALPPIMSLLPAIFNLLQRCCEDYIQIIMNISIYPSEDDEEKNTMSSYDNLVDSIYSFISCIVEVQDSPQYLYSVLSELIYSIVLFMTITPKIEEIWREDEINMYTDDCEDMVLNNIRSVMRNLLKRIGNHFDKAKLIAALNNAIEKHSNSANQLKAESEAYWWRIHECLMYAVGSLSDVLNRPNVEFRDLSNYLVQWSDFMNVCNVDLVLGRIIWVGGKFSHLLDRQYTEKHIRAILEHLKSNHHVSRVLALRALYFHCEAFRVSNNLSVFKDNLNDLLECLVNMGNQSQGITALILDCMCNIVNKVVNVDWKSEGKLYQRWLWTKSYPGIDFFFKVSQPPDGKSTQWLAKLNNLLREDVIIRRSILDKSLTARHSSRIVPYVMGTFLRNISNNLIMHKIQNLVSTLSRNLNMIMPMQHDFLPFIVNVIQQPGSPAYDATDIRTVTMDILTCFVKFAQTPLNNTLIEQGFMTIVKSMHMFTDITLLQSTASCLRAFLLQAPEEICHLREHDRQRGVELIMNIVSFFLNPTRQGCACNIVGKLIIACMKALGPFIEAHIQIILKDVLTKMHNAFIKVYDDSIVIAFVFTFYQHYDSTVTLLSVIPGPDGGSALEFVFTRWIKSYMQFYETYERNLNTMAFTQVLERAVMSDDKRVMKIMVSSEPLNGEICHTRQTSNGPRDEKIPVLVKIFKILISTLCIEIQESRQQQVYDQEIAFVETMEYMKIESGLVDPLDARDPIYFMNTVEYLCDFLRKLAHYPYYCTILAHLNPVERAEMGNMGLLLQPPTS